MKITEAFIENSLIQGYFYDFCKQPSSDNFDEECLELVTEMCFLNCYERFGNILQVITNLKQHKYAEAKIGLRNKENYRDFKKDIFSLRNSSKRLIELIIITSAITNDLEIRQHKVNWQSFDNFENEMNMEYYHQHLIYQQFKKVETLEELAEFNVIFHQYLIEMAFKLAEIFIRRMTYTIEYLQNDEAFKEVCREATLNLWNFRNEIEKLKRKPLDVNHIDT